MSLLVAVVAAVLLLDAWPAARATAAAQPAATHRARGQHAGARRPGGRSHHHRRRHYHHRGRAKPEPGGRRSLPRGVGVRVPGAVSLVPGAASLVPGAASLPGAAPVQAPGSPPAAPSPSVSPPATPHQGDPRPCADADLIASAANLARIRAATLCLVNVERVVHGVAAVRENEQLDAAAQGHATELVALNYFAHVGPSGVGLAARVLATGYAANANSYTVSENLAAEGLDRATPSTTVAHWMASAEHRANVLNPAFDETGVGVVAALPPAAGFGLLGATFCQIFGVRR